MTIHSWRDSHMHRSAKSLLKALYVTLGVFLALFVGFHILGALYASSIADESSKDFQAGIANDLAYLKKQGDAVAADNLVQEYLLAEDSESLISLLQKERAQRSIGLMGVANAEGLVVGRTLSTSVRGDNVFLTFPHGRAVSEGRSVESIELSGFNNQLLMTTARPMMRDGQMVGALFANYLTDDAYAQRFQDKYLSPGVEVVFYTKEYGIYGNSFQDSQIHALLGLYINSGSAWIQNGDTEKTISFDNKNLYFVKNIVFPGLEESPGGAMLFIPRKDISAASNNITLVLTLLVFLCFAGYFHVRDRGQEHGWRYVGMVLLISILVGVVAYGVLLTRQVGFLQLKRIPYPLYNSMIHFHPESGVFNLHAERRISLTVHPSDEVINSVQVGLRFDPSMVEVRELDIADSKCSYVIENTIDAVSGTADFSCVILNDGKQESSLLIATVVATPRAAGTFALTFNKETTKVLADDGLGTDVLRMSQSGTYQAEDFSDSQSLVVFSPTHPNQGRWYNARAARFVWRREADVVYYYELNTSADTIPSPEKTVKGSSITLPIATDGTFYFHLRRGESGLTAHYTVHSDRTPPSILSMRLSQDVITAGDVVRFQFEAEDYSSGVQRNYYVDLGNHLFLPTGSELFVPFLEAGEQNVVLRVYDDANNYTERSQIIYVKNQ